jgi:hypothetical protein
LKEIRLLTGTSYKQRKIKVNDLRTRTSSIGALYKLSTNKRLQAIANKNKLGIVNMNKTPQAQPNVQTRGHKHEEETISTNK